MSAGSRFDLQNSILSILAVLSALACLVTTFLIWRQANAHQEVWPFPALYFIEVAALVIIAAYWIISSSPTYLTWAASGLLFGFAILGLMSVGLNYIPFALIYALLSLFRDLGNGSARSIPAHLGIFILAAIIQAVLMFAIVSLILT